MRVAYLGPQGTFSDEATRHCDLVRSAAHCPCNTLADAYERVLRGDADAALLPIENSIEGAVGTTLDLLVHKPGLVIRRELLLPIEQHLLGRAGTELDAAVRVLSHPQALGQCSVFLHTRLPCVPLEATHSTADAARRAAEEASGTLAIGSRAAAERFGLAVLVPCIHDADENTTRFVLVAKDDERPTGRDRTSIAFTLDRDRPGGLHDVLGEFARLGINLCKIESRPTKRALGHYVFFIDFEGHRLDPACAAALEAVRSRAHELLVLGSYPRV